MLEPHDRRVPDVVRARACVLPNAMAVTGSVSLFKAAWGTAWRVLRSGNVTWLGWMTAREPYPPQMLVS